MRRLPAFLLAVLVVICSTAVAAAQPPQKDAPGCRDHPLFTRMPGTWMHHCTEEQFDAHGFDVGEAKPTTVEGHTWAYTYYPQASLASKPSELQIIRNFQNAWKELGGTVRFERKGRTTLVLEKDGKEIWVDVTAEFTGKYGFHIVERQAMKQDVVSDADFFAKGLAATGHVVVEGIYFDTAKADLKPESEPALAEMVKLLQSQPKLAVYVVGHTDTVGDLAMNVKLSQARAESVVRALVKAGIGASRLAAHGNGPYAPVASNDDETGRARNRRVELVKQ